MTSTLQKAQVRVPQLDLQRQYRQIKEEVLAAIERVCSSQHFILGEEVEKLEQEIATFTGAQFGVGCASGTDALWLALVASGVKAGDKVITTAFSFFASGSSITRCGAQPVFVDIEPQTFNIDPAGVRTRLDFGGDHKVSALLPVHLYGQCADMATLRALAGEFKLALIEDAAQAIGARLGNGKAGSMGEAAAFSFYPTKNLSAFGDAGLTTCSNKELAEKMRRLRNHGSPKRYEHAELGWNCRMDAIQAAVLRIKLNHVESWNAQRRHHAESYDRLLKTAGLTGVKGSTSAPVKLPVVLPTAVHVFHQYVIRAERRDELRKFLAERQIGTEVYYPIPLHLQPAFAYLGYREGDLPQSERAAQEALALPMFAELTEEEQKHVVEEIATFYS
jgi:dTDP-4-amino-4,6-dideoxygalactose transaminase